MTDGGAVYSKPDFDAPVSDYLPFKSKLWVTKKAVPGVGGLGLFHHVRYKDKAGFVVDTDIRITSKDVDSTDVPKKKSAHQHHEKKTSSVDDEKVDGRETVFFKRYVGGALALVNFTEKFSGQKFSDQMLMYGLRMSGPGTLFDGPPLDVNIWFSVQKPGYYSKFTSTPPQGFLMFGDFMVVLPFYEGTNTMVTYGLGAMWTYTSYKVQVKNSRFDSQEFRIGADLGLGVTHRFGRYAVKGDVKYYYEKTQYLGWIASFQTEY